MKIKITGLSLKELKEKYGVGGGGFYRQNWYEDEPFFVDKPAPGVYEIQLEKKQLHNLTYEEQKAKLKRGWTFPHPAIVAEALLNHYKATGERLMGNWWTRTSLVDSGGHRVRVGIFDAVGLFVDYWDGYRNVYIGASSVRQSERILEPGSLESSDLSTLESRISALEERMDRYNLR